MPGQQQQLLCLDQQQRDEQVWVLLLGRAWQPLHQQVICRLLCCSKGMADLVHATCAGRLPAVLRKSWMPRMTMLSPTAPQQHQQPPGSLQLPLPAGAQQQPQLQLLPDMAMLPPLAAAQLQQQQQPVLGPPSIAAAQQQGQQPQPLPGVLPPAAAPQQQLQQEQGQQLALNPGLPIGPGMAVPTPEQLQELRAKYAVMLAAAKSALQSAQAVSQEDAQYLRSDAPGHWMAKHAVLLSSLEVSIRDVSEQGLAEGIKAAAAVSGPSAAATSAPAATAGSTAVAAQLQGGIPLQSLELRGPANGSLLCAVAGSKQLTKLSLQLTIVTLQKPEVQAAVASLAGLQDLTVVEGSATSPRFKDGWFHEWDKVALEAAEAPTAFEQLTPALEGLTSLTRLAYAHAVPLRQSCVQPLPASLLNLQLGQDWDSTCYPCAVRKDGCDLSHLTALTHLIMADLQTADVLPESLVSLKVPKSLSLLPALKLQHLQKLDIGWIPGADEVRQLAELPMLQEVRLEAATHEYSAPQKALKKAAPYLGTFPLKSLNLSMFDITTPIMEGVAMCTGLTNLTLGWSTVNTALDKFAGGLAQLSSLEEVKIERPEWGSKARCKDKKWEAGMRAICKALAGLPELRHVWLAGWSLRKGAGEFVAATQLRTLMLDNCSVDAKLEGRLMAALEPHGVDVFVGR